MSKSISIVDDHKLFASSLRVLVNSFDGFKLLDYFKNGQELVDHVQSDLELPDVLLLDMRMPVMDGLQTMTWLKENQPDLKVLALTVDQEDETIIRMLKLGARGYLLKDIDPDEFELALNRIVDTGYYTNQLISEAYRNEGKAEKYEVLTGREQEFLCYACSELTYKAIASEMNLSPKTVENYRESLFNKLRVKSRVGLVMVAIKEGYFKI
ncbi:response regulator transcription factor [uncultured Christiangramia sp.]|uniref:response regulator transcription factor n=1 Tax=uncultured Christiangramia sp. TaxID=503836 RepID=UPI0025F924AC|nr:response regulator transcription factor [uncultured Christiangramia sp.]|tara:strand:- start:120 stop:752 length:633 start_codon:yes stop_codon:yes gene_type:complete